MHVYVSVLMRKSDSRMCVRISSAFLKALNDWKLNMKSTYSDSNNYIYNVKLTESLTSDT